MPGTKRRAVKRARLQYGAGTFAFAALAMLLGSPNQGKGQTTLYSNTIDNSVLSSSSTYYTTGQVTATGVVGTGLEIGTGVTAATNTGRYGGSAFNATTQDNTKFIKLVLGPATNYSLSLSTFAGDYQASSTGPTTYALDYQIGTGTITQIATGTNSRTGVAVAFSFSLASTAALQNDTSPITLYLYEYGASSSSGTFTINDFTVSGTATSTATTYQYFDENGMTPGSGITNGNTYSLSGSVFNASSDGTGTVGAFTTGGTLTFSAGTDAASSTYTVTVDSAISTNGIAFNSTNVTVNAGSGSLTLTGASVNVGTGDAATIAAPIGGSVGLTKDGAGILTLSGTTSAFTGNVTVDSGTLSISTDTNLGTTSNAVVLNGGILQTTAGFTFTHNLSGSGSLDIAAGTTLASTGTFGTTALTLTNTGTLDLQGERRPAVGSLTFGASGHYRREHDKQREQREQHSVLRCAHDQHRHGHFDDLRRDQHRARFHTRSRWLASTTLALTNSAFRQRDLCRRSTGTGTLEPVRQQFLLHRLRSALGGAATSGGTISINSANSLGTSTISGTTGLPTTNLNFNTRHAQQRFGRHARRSPRAFPSALPPAGTGAVLSGSDMNFLDLRIALQG